VKGTSTPVVLTADLVEAFAAAYLSPIYDNPVPTPEFHRTCWSLYASDAPLCAVAAPREHAKSTALTHDFGLATALFRTQDYIIIVSATEDLAIDHLGEIAKELRENEDIIRDFGVKGLSVDAKTDVIVEFTDGHQCRFRAKGSGQKMRGMKWNGKRPGLIICDDLEEDEQVENRDRRLKFRRWFYRALLPCRRRGGIVRMHGTILHEDALLSRVQRSTVWKHLLFKAHESFDDFSSQLWPEAFPTERLRAIRQAFIDDQDPAGYSQEYLNDPFDNTDAYLRKDDFLPMKEDDFDSPKTLAVGCDFAVSKADKANRTSFTVGGQDTANVAHIFDQYAGRWDTKEWVETLFIINKRYSDATFFVEDGVIWKSVSPFIYKEMMRRGNGNWINFQPIMPVKDKATRGRDLQKMHRAGACRFHKTAEWYEGYESELLRFTGSSDAVLDDQFDSTALLIKGLNTIADVDMEDFVDEEEMELVLHDPRKHSGRSRVTGY
jgi:predicted phage terminase large subunit-like protein